MKAGEWNEHWCQADFATTCLIRHLRQSCGLEAKTPLALLDDRFDERSGLFFANPYLVDWGLALALQGETGETAQRLRERLKREILASTNADHSFGMFDIPLSTALAVLSLAALGYRGRFLKLVQLRLSEIAMPEETVEIAKPFYSTYKVPDVLGILYAQGGDLDSQVFRSEGEHYAMSYYADQHKIVSTALVAMALEGIDGSDAPAEGGEATPAEYSGVRARGEQNAHPRYRCNTQEEYIARYAQPPYLKKSNLLQKEGGAIQDEKSLEYGGQA
jgi:hypothetical protein